jgi:hypothetical protein
MTRPHQRDRREADEGFVELGELPVVTLVADEAVPPLSPGAWPRQLVQAPEIETQRQWSEVAIRRATPALLGLFSVVTLFALRRTVQGGAFGQAAWYQKRHPAFADALALVRKDPWDQEERTFCGLPVQTDAIKVPRAFMERLTETVCYAAQEVKVEPYDVG